jgi:arylsulfatase A-like enzyme
MMIHAPNRQGASVYQYDYVSDAIAESVDLFPTIAELAGLQLPSKVRSLDALPCGIALKRPIPFHTIH